jgi:hypothetical protein
MTDGLTDEQDKAFDKLYEDFRALFYNAMTKEDTPPQLALYALFTAMQTIMMDIRCPQCRAETFKEIGEQFKSMFRDSEKEALRMHKRAGDNKPCKGHAH